MFEPGAVVTGRVARIVDFGAFVDLIGESDEGQATGLLHVSEIAHERVDNVYAHISEGDVLDVKIISVADDGKIALSLRRLDDDWEEQATSRGRSSTVDGDFERRLRRFLHESQMNAGELRRQRERRRDPTGFARRRRTTRR